VIEQIRAACAGTLLVALSLASPQATAKDIEYRGNGTYVVAQTLMPLGNGGAAVQTNSEVILNLDPSGAAFLFGNCAGLAYLSADGQLNSTAYCNLMEDLDNGLDVKVSRADGAMSGEIIGGWGKWAGAGGSVSITPVSDNESSGNFAFAMYVVTP